MVPGSTLRYGSNFWQVTVNPRLSSRQPIDAAAMPFPSDETTPPVTNINLAIRFHPLHERSFKELRDPCEVFGRIHADGIVLGFHHTDGITVFKRAELLQALELFQRTHLQRRVGQQE